MWDVRMMDVRCEVWCCKVLHEPSEPLLKPLLAAEAVQFAQHHRASAVLTQHTWDGTDHMQCELNVNCPVSAMK